MPSTPSSEKNSSSNKPLFENISTPTNKNISSSSKLSQADLASENTDASSSNTVKPIDWSPENEIIIVEWCDVAQCYKWMHSRSHEYYSNLHAFFIIPAIIFSTITGTASFAQTSLPTHMQPYAPMVIGSINICIGILTTIQQYLKVSEFNEAHRVSAISWDKFARNIRIELAKSPNERMDAAHFLKLNRQEYDRLMETSPSIHKNIVDEFNYKFSGKIGSIERKRFEELKKPDICNIIISANENRHHWYKDAGSMTIEDTVDHTNIDIISEENDILKTERESQKQLRIQQTKKLTDFVNKFYLLHGRRPIVEEITENYKDEINKEILARFIDKYSTDEVHIQP